MGNARDRLLLLCVSGRPAGWLAGWLAGCCHSCDPTGWYLTHRPTHSHLLTTVEDGQEGFSLGLKEANELEDLRP